MALPGSVASVAAIPLAASLAVPLPPALAVEVGPGQSGPIGLIVILVLCAGCVLLFRSMSRQLKRVPRSFDETADQAAQPARPAPPAGPAGGRSAADQPSTGPAASPSDGRADA